VQTFIDVGTAAGDLDVIVTSGPKDGPTVRSVARGGLTIMGRTPTMLTPGAPVAGDFAAPFETALFGFSPAAGAQVTTLDVSDDSLMTSPGFLILPKSGQFIDNYGAPAARRWLGTSGTDPFYAVLWDFDGGAPHGYTVTRRELAATAVAETAEPANDRASAATIPSLPAVITATFQNGADQDWFAVTLNAGQRVRIVTHGGDPRTDTRVALYEPDGTTIIGSELDLDFHEMLFSVALLASGTHYVRISASPQFEPAHASYIAVVLTE
jgi:hypothetical protein